MSNTKYIFVTGGVVSGLGKGITAASLGRLLKARGFKVAAQKLDPYINVDPGTMNPFEHGEVFVTDDGAEADLDLGHYERFIDENITKYSNLTTGKVYSNVIERERRGGYLGHTVQIIPHITDEIKLFVKTVGKTAKADIVITEIGGTAGDIESLPYLEAIRQIGQEEGRENCLYIHVTLVPFVPGSDELKTKPTQHSCKELQGLGIMPNIIVTRCDQDLPPALRAKIAMFCNVKPDCVINNRTVPVLYEAPLMLEEANFSQIVCRELNLDGGTLEIGKWTDMVNHIKSIENSVNIGIVGKYTALHDAYLSIVESLKHAGWAHNVNVNIAWVDSNRITDNNAAKRLAGLDGILVPGGFGDRAIEGMINTAKFARENNIPYFGICLGMQIAAIEFARNVLGFEDANSVEFAPDTENKVIHLMKSQYSVDDKKGGTMRLGACPAVLTAGSLLHKAYGATEIRERHRHRYEFNNAFRSAFEDAGIVFSAKTPDDALIEAIEYPKNKFHAGVQYHPEFKSRPDKPHPLFAAFLAACKK